MANRRQVGLFDASNADSVTGLEDAPKRTAGGEPTTDLVFSAHVGANADVFRQILDLHVPVGATVADVTYGLGAFWRSVPHGSYNLLPSDLDVKLADVPKSVADLIKTGVDCRDLPYQDASLDCVVLDPPYMEGLYRKSESHLAGSGTHASFRKAYSTANRATPGRSGTKPSSTFIAGPGSRRTGFSNRTAP